MKQESKTKKIKVKEGQTKKAVKKVLAQRDLSSGRIYIQSTFNNTIVTLTDAGGNVIAWNSAGRLGLSGTRKSTPYIASQVAKAIAEQTRDFGIRKVSIFVSGIGTGRDSAVRALQGADLDIASIADTTPVAHNGCRAKKPRRV
jgi:small subunit ribosomal protein S11